MDLDQDEFRKKFDKWLSGAENSVLQPYTFCTGIGQPGECGKEEELAVT